MPMKAQDTPTCHIFDLCVKVLEFVFIIGIALAPVHLSIRSTNYIGIIPNTLQKVKDKI